MNTLRLLVFCAVCATGSPLHAAVLAWYRFENNLFDNGGNNLNATGGTGYSFSSSAAGAALNPGGVADAFSLVPGSSPVAVAANGILSSGFSSGSFTLEAFVYLNPGASNFQEILGNVSGSTGIYFAVGTGNGHSGDFSGYNGNGVAVSKSVGTGLGAGVWHHVAWVGSYTSNSGTAVQFYVDGVATGTPAFFAQPSGGAAPRPSVMASTANWQIGGPSNRFNGLIDELRISDTALTPGQFLTAIPEPSDVSLCLLTGLGAALVLRKRHSCL